VKPTITRFSGASHPVLHQIAPGEREFGRSASAPPAAAPTAAAQPQRSRRRRPQRRRTPAA
jgi:hypothetical protein